MLRETKEGVILPVKVIPKSSKSEIVGWENDELKIRIRALPSEGAANEELIRFLSDYLHLAKSNIDIIAGKSSRHKKLRIRSSFNAVSSKFPTFLTDNDKQQRP